MDLILRIGGDPASWIVRGGDYEGLIAQLRNATAPVVVQVGAPVSLPGLVRPRHHKNPWQQTAPGVAGGVPRSVNSCRHDVSA